MHVPDGFLSPATYLTITVVDSGLWFYAIRQTSKNLSRKQIPVLAALTAFAYIISSVQFPIPASTSIHLTGIPLLALKLGLWNSFLSFSFVFLLQAVLFGLGGITSFPLNSFALGFIGPLVVVSVHRLFTNRIHSNLSIAITTTLGILSSALVIGLILGLQPILAKNLNGEPLFFPYDWTVVLPSILLGNLPVVLLEIIVTIPLYNFLERIERR